MTVSSPDSGNTDTPTAPVCRWPMGHRDKHICACICALPLGHKGRHQCEIQYQLEAPDV